MKDSVRDVEEFWEGSADSGEARVCFPLIVFSYDAAENAVHAVFCIFDFWVGGAEAVALGCGAEGPGKHELGIDCAWFGIIGAVFAEAEVG